MPREVKFSSILTSLIEAGGYRGNRSEILAAAGVTSSALSQYLRGQSRPSFQTLVALAEFFGVSLDYLVFGDDVGTASAPDIGPLARYMDVSLRGVELRAQQHSAMVARIGSILSEKIDDAAREIIRTAASTVPSLLSEDDVMRLESNSLECRIALLDLQNDIVELPENQGDAMGKFMPIVGRNIAMGRPYKFLLLNRPGVDWRDLAVRMRGLLRTQCSADAVNRYCEIRVTDSPLFAGVALYLLDEPALRTAAPAFYEMIRPYVDAHGWAGNAVPPHGSTYAAAMFDMLHLSNALRQFELLWRRGSVV